VHLKVKAERLGLHKSETEARQWIPRVGAM
jgi:hypothetical protein